MTTHVGFTGNRWGMALAQKLAVERLVDDITADNYKGAGQDGDIVFHMGDCVGSDKEFYQIVGSLWRRVGHPPSRTQFRAFLDYDEERPVKDYLPRNKDIVDESSILIATPASYDEIVRSGTWSTVRYAMKKRKIVYIIFPDGTRKIGVDGEFNATKST